ncbi:hypothetical protein CCP3SC1_1520006 [Gammaproteobacteria bacterium]
MRYQAALYPETYKKKQTTNANFAPNASHQKLKKHYSTP